MHAISILGLAVAVAAPLPKERPKSTPSIVGEWVLEEQIIDGDQTLFREKFRYDFGPDGKYTIDVPGWGRIFSYKYVTDPTKSPAAIDLDKPVDGVKTCRGIFEVNGDTLKVCYTSGGERRPTKFESTSDKPATLCIFKRVKKE